MSIIRSAPFRLNFFMWLLLNDNNYVTRFLPWEFISLPMIRILSIVGRAFINFNIKNLFFLNHFFAITALAFVFFINNFTFSITNITRTLALSVHTWSNHLHPCNHTSATARSALLDSTFFTSFTFARSTNTLSVHSNFCPLARVNFLESHLEWVG